MSHLDRGGLKYASISFIARLTTVKKFMNSLMPKLKGMSAIKQGLVSFLSPYVSSCPELTCDLGRFSLGKKESSTE